jgi:5-(carboxyamino)imidazole ribonucleotide mutase
MEVLVIVGSESDLPLAEKIKPIFDELNISYEIKVLSAHRNLSKLIETVKTTDAKVFIAIAGLV